MIVTLTFSIEIDGEMLEEMDEDRLKELLLEILADQPDKDLLQLIEVHLPYFSNLEKTD